MLISSYGQSKTIRSDAMVIIQTSIMRLHGDTKHKSQYDSYAAAAALLLPALPVYMEFSFDHYQSIQRRDSSLPREQESKR